MFYAKLALSNLRKSKGVFGPFLLASLVLFTLVSGILQLLLSPVSQTMGTGSISLALGAIVLIIFSVIMEVYSFRFLMTQRARELGLYHLLGMKKSQVAKIAGWELLASFGGLLVAGSLLSAVLSNVLYLVFAKLVQYQDLHFSIQPLAFVYTALIFAGIFVLLALISWGIIGTSSPLILFRSAEKGEKEPKSNWFFAFLAMAFLGGGYYLSLSSPAVGGQTIILRFFYAVVCVIVGTYLFYLAFMTWYLKWRKSQAKYYYQPKHFVSTSQMLFRMKQHALGLANITLLAVMAFVTIATTAALYSGFAKVTEDLFPQPTRVSLNASSRQEASDLWQDLVVAKLPQAGEKSQASFYFLHGISYDLSPSLTIDSQSLAQADPKNLYFFYVVTQEDLRAFDPDIPQLADHQVAYYINGHQGSMKNLTVGDTGYEVLPALKEVTYPGLANTYNAALLIVPNDQVLDQIGEEIKQTDPSLTYSYDVYTQISDQDLEKIASLENGYAPLYNQDQAYVGGVTQKDWFHKDIMAFTGGFLFTGFLLGISFLLGAALIIYYKQYSEGLEDRKAYRILQEVGMRTQEVKNMISAQTVMMFFLPLAMAVLHFVVSLVVLRQLLALFGITSTSLILTVSAFTVLFVLALYFVIYRLTSRVYYQLVKR